MDLIIIRHARPVRDERGEGEGFADPELSEVGYQQARATAEFLAGEEIHHVVASSMRRAHQTAVPLAETLGVQIELSDALREVDQHRSAYVPAEEMRADDPIVAEFLADQLSIFDGDYEGFRDRVEQGFEHVIATNKGRRVAVFCHGMVMGVYLQTLVGHDDPYKLGPDYCGIMRVRASSTGIRSVLSMNETGHVRHLL